MAPNVPEKNGHLQPTTRRHRRRLSDLALATDRPMPCLNKLCYSVGHMLNDLCSAIWFTYTLIFLQYIVKLSSTKAGLVIMVGQLGDAICTPLIGTQLDDGRMFCARNVKPKSWHLLGTICVVVSFPLLFVECRACDQNSTGFYLGLLFLVTVFQFGWAATQVSHLSLIPQITSCSRERDLLSNLRYSVQELAQILCFFVAWLTFNFVGEQSVNKKDAETIGIEDAPKVRNLVFITTGIGLVFAIFFQLGVHEKLKNNASCDNYRRNLIGETEECKRLHDRLEDEESSLVESSDGAQRGHWPTSRKWTKWLKNPRFYQVCAVYLFSRLFTNISSAFFPLYLEVALGAPQIMIIYIPLVLNISGLATCLLLEPINGLLGKKISFAFFCCVSLSGCTIIFLDDSPNFAGSGEYGMAILMGSGSAAMVAIALSFVPDIFGADVQNGALVYGLLSFVEKLVNGIAVLVIQYSHSIVCADCENCVWFYRYLMLYALGAIILAAFVGILTMLPGSSEQAFRRDTHDDHMSCPVIQCENKENDKVAMRPQPEVDTCNSEGDVITVKIPHYGTM